mmetsp:Transcript_138/g.498  ORF Transcript_138/g.498 Transcript_138/m.498 type:complete len:121 (+) Transcript_138:248-610(+)
MSAAVAAQVDSDTVFSIDDSDGTHIEFNLARLNAQHAELLRQAKRSISATESQVRWLRDERLQARLFAQCISKMLGHHPHANDLFSSSLVFTSSGSFHSAICIQATTPFCLVCEMLQASQ